MINLDECNPIPERMDDLRQRQTANKIRVAVPGIVQDFDPGQQTVTVQVAIREKLNNDGEAKWAEIPLLLDVPLVFPRAGGYILTLPIVAGDEVLVIFGDNCMDAWWQSGGVQNQIDIRRHDLSDAFAIPGPWSQPRRVIGYSTNSAQLRNEAGNAYVEISGSTINIVGAAVNIQGIVKIAGGQTSIDGKNFLAHRHSGVEPGGGNTGGVS